MKVHLIRKEPLEEYAWLNPQSRGPMEECYTGSDQTGKLLKI